MPSVLTILLDLIAGAALVTGMSTLLERSVLTHVMHDPVRSHLLSLFLGWALVITVVLLMNPWRSEVPLMFALAAIPVAFWRVAQGRRERTRIGHHRAEPAWEPVEQQRLHERDESGEEGEESEADRRRDDSMMPF